jgi:hypothetical protein
VTVTIFVDANSNSGQYTVRDGETELEVPAPSGKLEFQVTSATWSFTDAATGVHAYFATCEKRELRLPKVDRFPLDRISGTVTGLTVDPSTGVVIVAFDNAATAVPVNGNFSLAIEDKAARRDLVLHSSPYQPMTVPVVIVRDIDAIGPVLVDAAQGQALVASQPVPPWSTWLHTAGGTSLQLSADPAIAPRLPPTLQVPGDRYEYRTDGEIATHELWTDGAPGAVPPSYPALVPPTAHFDFEMPYDKLVRGIVFHPYDGAAGYIMSATIDAGGLPPTRMTHRLYLGTRFVETVLASSTGTLDIQFPQLVLEAELAAFISSGGPDDFPALPRPVNGTLRTIVRAPFEMLP